MASSELVLPNGWDPRRHQMRLWSYLQSGGKRAAVVWHRRAGKDSTALNWAACAAMQRVGTYWHMLPEAKQGRKVVWDGIDRSGRRMIDQAFPAVLRDSVRDDEMRIRLKNGSVWQVVGSDNYNSLVGSNPVGVVFSEYSVARPAAWDYIRPILAENGGWAVFIFTPRGENHGYDLFKMAENHPDWFHEILTVNDTGIVSSDMIEEERRSGMPEEMIEQEYFCSFSAALVGSYYGKILNEIEAKGRLSKVAYDPLLPVHTAWDLGVHDDMVQWFFQIGSGELRIIDHYASSGEGIPHYVEVIQRKEAEWRALCDANLKPNEKSRWKQGEDWVPHDAKVRELGTGRTRIEVMISLGRKPRLVPDHTVADGIQAVRETLPRCWFDKERCAGGLKSLRLYQRAWNDDRRCFLSTPQHDWTSHDADAFRYLAMAWREIVPPPPPPKSKIFAVGDENEVSLEDLFEEQERRERSGYGRRI